MDKTKEGYQQVIRVIIERVECNGCKGIDFRTEHTTLQEVVIKQNREGGHTDIYASHYKHIFLRCWAPESGETLALVASASVPPLSSSVDSPVRLAWRAFSALMRTVPGLFLPSPPTAPPPGIPPSPPSPEKDPGESTVE